MAYLMLDRRIPRPLPQHLVPLDPLHGINAGDSFQGNAWANDIGGPFSVLYWHNVNAVAPDGSGDETGHILAAGSSSSGLDEHNNRHDATEWGTRVTHGSYSGGAITIQGAVPPGHVYDVDSSTDFTRRISYLWGVDRENDATSNQQYGTNNFGLMQLEALSANDTFRTSFRAQSGTYYEPESKTNIFDRGSKKVHWVACFLDHDLEQIGMFVDGMGPWTSDFSGEGTDGYYASQTNDHLYNRINVGYRGGICFLGIVLGVDYDALRYWTRNPGSLWKYPNYRRYFVPSAAPPAGGDLLLTLAGGMNFNAMNGGMRS